MPSEREVNSLTVNKKGDISLGTLVKDSNNSYLREIEGLKVIARFYAVHYLLYVHTHIHVDRDMNMEMT